jgi:hypothetical protein
MKNAIIVFRDGQFIGIFFTGRNDDTLVCRANGGNSFIRVCVDGHRGPVVHNC